MRVLTSLSVLVLLLFLAVPEVWAQPLPPGDVGSPECGAAHDACIEAISNGDFQNHGKVVKACAQASNQFNITDECHSCIVNPVARGVPIAEQETCGPTCPCYDASDIEGQGIDFMAQVFTDADCFDILPEAIQLRGSRDGSGSGVEDPQAWIANADSEIGSAFCLFRDNLFGISISEEPITQDQVQACFDILLASQMFLLNNCPND